jgi:threonine/homoserine/homoserine lactone efflux protein
MVFLAFAEENDAMHAGLLWKGGVLGFSIAAPVGPIGALAIGRTLRHGRGAGLATGLGAAAADAVYGAAAAMGLSAVAVRAASVVPRLRWAGGAFLVGYGIRLLLARGRGRRSGRVAPGGGAFFSAFLLTLANPMTILAFAAMLGSFGATTGAAGTLLVSGVFLGSMAWWALLSSVVAAAAWKLDGRWLSALDLVCGCALAAFGLYALCGRK